MPECVIPTLPPGTSNPNPLTTESLVIAAAFSPGILYAVDRQTGLPRWSRRISKLGSDAVVAQGNVLYACSSHTVHAVREETGEELWSYCPHGTGAEHTYCVPAVGQDGVYFGDRSSMIHRLDRRSGEVVWANVYQEAGGGHINGGVLLTNEGVIAASNAGKLFLVDHKSGAPVWSVDLDGPSILQPLQLGSFAVAATTETVFFVNLRDGSVHHSQHFHERRILSVCVSPQAVFVLTRSNLDEERTSGSGVDPLVRVHALFPNTTQREYAAERHMTDLRWEGELDALVLTGIVGLQIVDSTSGDVLWDAGNDWYMAGLASARDGNLYAMAAPALAPGGVLMSFSGVRSTVEANRRSSSSGQVQTNAP